MHSTLACFQGDYWISRSAHDPSAPGERGMAERRELHVHRGREGSVNPRGEPSSGQLLRVELRDRHREGPLRRRLGQTHPVRASSKTIFCSTFPISLSHSYRLLSILFDQLQAVLGDKSSQTHSSGNSSITQVREHIQDYQLELISRAVCMDLSPDYVGNKSH